MPQDEQKYFSHPSEKELEKGLTCEEPGCSGQYLKKLRDIKMKRKGNTVTIQDSEYWECDLCENFVTAKEEIQRIQKQAKEQENYTGRLTLRLNPELHRQLAEEAQINHRSLNNELAYRLEKSLKNQETNKRA